MAPLGDRILVKGRKIEEKSAGGIILATTGGSNKFDMAEALTGDVVAVGSKVKLAVSKGDVVLFSKAGTSDIEVADGEITFVAESSVLATLQE